MITGYVNPELETVVVLKIRGPEGQELSLEAVVDTGYSRYLTAITRSGEIIGTSLSR
jgi:hypothetical protein